MIVTVFKNGTLCFFSECFGRPYDNYHRVVSCELIENELILFFDDNEKCIIIDPDGIISNEKTFVVRKARKIIWQWYYYGKPQTEENCRIIEYERIDSETISKKTNQGTEFIKSKKCNAFEIL